MREAGRERERKRESNMRRKERGKELKRKKTALLSAGKLHMRTITPPAAVQ